MPENSMTLNVEVYIKYETCCFPLNYICLKHFKSTRNAI